MLKIALISLDQCWEDKEQNWKQVVAYAKKAAEQKADVVIFPEMTLTGFSMNTAYSKEAASDSETVMRYKELAVAQQIAIIGGVVFEEADKAYNVCVAIDASGHVSGNYRKIHPFSMGQENTFFKPGTEIVCLDWEGIWGLSICYDLRFPELYRALAEQCSVAVNIANWPAARKMHWLTLLRARAIENQMFVMGVNRVGTDGNGLIYEESSTIFSPNGDELVACYEENGMKIFEVDVQDVTKHRNQFPFLKDRVPQKIEFKRNQTS